MRNSSPTVNAPINVEPHFTNAPVFNNNIVGITAPVHSVRSRREEWLTLSKEFDNLPSGINVAWKYDTTGGKGIEEWGPIPNQRCVELCTQGGLMMLSSPQLLAATYEKTLTEQNPIRLWLQCIHERKGVEKNPDIFRYPNGDGTYTSSLSGKIQSLAHQSANLCRACANWELMQEAS